MGSQITPSFSARTCAPKSLMRVLTIAGCVAIGYSQTSPNLFQEEKEAVAVNPQSSLAHFRLGEAYLLQKRFQPAANEFREALNGDLTPKWIEVWAHINLGKVFDITGQCARAVNEYNLALRTEVDAFGAQHEVGDYLNSNIIRPITRLSEAAVDPELPPGVHRPGTGVISPILHTKVPAEYSDAARMAGLEGTVLLETIIGEDGSATRIRATRTLGLGLDERAIEAVRKWRFTPGLFQAQPVSVLIDVAVDFFLPSRQSRWHLVGVAFDPPKGASDPVFEYAYYPSGAGVARTAIDDARLINAMGRFAGVGLSFDVNEEGVPVHFRIRKTSNELWGAEALSIVQNWRFKPGEKDGIPVSVLTTVDMVWGERNLTASPVPILRGLSSSDQNPPSEPQCRTNHFSDDAHH